MQNEILWLALNAKYSHTSLAVRYLRESVAGSVILELTINHQLMAIVGELYEKRPRVLGIACYIWNIELVKNLLQVLPKALSDTVIILGGPEVSYNVKSLMENFAAIDYIVRGEGEESTARLIARLRAADFDAATVNSTLQNEPLAGVAFRAKDFISEGTVVTIKDLAAIGFPYREEEIADIKEKILYYETSRGCPFACAYCLSCATAGVRFLSLNRVFSELDFFTRHNVRQVKFVDRTFNAKKSHFLPILNYILELPPTCRTNFHFEVAIDYLDDEVLNVLAKMPKGRVQLEIGIQSTNEDTLMAVARVNHWDKIAGHILKIMSYRNMHLHVDLIIGLPNEGMAELHKSFNDVYSLKTDMLQIGFLKFLHGAKMLELVTRYGYEYMPIAPYEVMKSDRLSYGELRFLHIFEDVFELYYNAARCRQTTEYLINNFAKGDAFLFYTAFSKWWENNGFHKIGHSTKNLYKYLTNFAVEKYGADSQVLDNLLRYDALTSDEGKIRPESLNWNREKYQSKTALFWKGLPSIVRKYIADYSFTNWRDIRTKYHIEIFDYDVFRLINGEKVPLEKLTPLLFDYTADDITVQKVIDIE